MALDLTALAPEASDWTPAPRGRQKADIPNPFLLNGWLQQSYDSGQAYKVTIEGTWEDVEKTDRQGNKVTRKVLRGDAATVVRLIREAADTLNIGSSIDVKPARKRGFVTVNYLGQKRKAPRAAKTPE